MTDKTIVGWIWSPLDQDYLPIHLWRPKNPQHGDFTTDAAFVLSRVGGYKRDNNRKKKEDVNA
jgi:arginyl-tRNA synthetase